MGNATTIMAGMLGVMVSIILGVILLPILVDFVSDAEFNNITYAGEAHDYTWAGTLIIVFFILGLALIPIVLVFLAMKGLKGK